MALATPLTAFWLGRRHYGPVHALQRELTARRKQGEIGDVVLFLEHEPVITLGRGGHITHVPGSEHALTNRGVQLVRTDRGGDVTLHAPGQLVAYPIVDLGPHRKDVRRYVRDLTDVMRQLAQRCDLDTGMAPDLIGLWVDTANIHRYPGAEHATNLAKLGAIGIKISRWVTMHGFAFNLTTDLSLFDLIVPCGIWQHGVTSVRALCGDAPSPEAVAPWAHERLAVTLQSALGAYHSLAEMEIDELGACLISRSRS